MFTIAIILALLILDIAFSYPHLNKIQQERKDTILTSRRCPPHRWKYQEIKDDSGLTVKWKIVCDVCGPMRSAEGIHGQYEQD